MAIIRPVPCKVSFKYPNGAIRKGEVIKATKVQYLLGNKNGDYATRVELIKIAGEKKRQIRFAYWRRPAGRTGNDEWNWASQTTWAFSVAITRKAIEEAKKIGLFD